MYKGVYIPKTGEAGVFISDNNASSDYKVVSVNQLKKISGIDVFPSLPAKAKNEAAEFPEVQQRNSKSTAPNHKPSKLKKLLFGL